MEYNNNTIKKMYYGSSLVNMAVASGGDINMPATTLVQDCYRQMFYGRSGFNKIACLATSGINTSNSTNNWLANTASSGTFTRAPGVSWPTGNSGRKNWRLVDYSG